MADSRWPSCPGMAGCSSRIGGVSWADRPSCCMFWVKADFELCARSHCKALQCARGRHGAAAFKAGNNRLLSVHPAGNFLLGETGARPRLDHGRGKTEFFLQIVICLPVVRIFKPTSMQLVKRCTSHGTSLALLRANVISSRGVFWVFFTKTRTITTLFPLAVT